MSFLQDTYYANRQLKLFEEPYSKTERMILRNGIRFYTTQCKAIPYAVACNYFKYYKLLYWSGNHLIESIEAGMIVRDDIAFIVKYHPNLTRGKILANPDAQYAISFRAAKDEYNIDAIAYISIAS